MLVLFVVQSALVAFCAWDIIVGSFLAYLNGRRK